MATVQQKIEGRNSRVLRILETADLTITDGAGSGTFAIPKGFVVTNVWCETATAIPGTPTNTNLRLGSAANGQQYVADVDVKGQGFLALTVIYAMRNAAAAADATVHWTVASSGGTAGSQDGSVKLYIEGVYPDAVALS